LGSNCYLQFLESEVEPVDGSRASHVRTLVCGRTGVLWMGVGGDYLTAPMPPVNTALVEGELAWRQHDGGHTDGPNWPAFLDWAKRHASKGF